MRFLRHLIAAGIAVAVIVGLGMLWAHASAAGTGIAGTGGPRTGGPGTGGGLGRATSREALERLAQIKAGAIRVHSDNGFHLASTGDLIRTCMIEAMLAAVVVTISAVRRRHRRMRRSAAAA